METCSEIQNMEGKNRKRLIYLSLKVTRVFLQDSSMNFQHYFPLCIEAKSGSGGA